MQMHLINFQYMIYSVIEWYIKLENQWVSRKEGGDKKEVKKKKKEVCVLGESEWEKSEWKREILDRKERER